MNAEEQAAIELLRRELGAVVIWPLLCQDCGEPGVRYDAPPDAAGVFCRVHARWLPARPTEREAECEECGEGYPLVTRFAFRDGHGREYTRPLCAQHRPARTPGGRPARLADGGNRP